MSNDHRVAVRVAHAVLLAIYDRSAPTLSPTLSPTLAVLALLAIYRVYDRGASRTHEWPGRGKFSDQQVKTRSSGRGLALLIL
jgi:hypothetical protein